MLPVSGVSPFWPPLTRRDHASRGSPASSGARNRPARVVPLSWQITPVALMQAITDPDPAVATRSFDAMMQMGKIDIAKIEAARRG